MKIKRIVKSCIAGAVALLSVFSTLPVAIAAEAGQDELAELRQQIETLNNLAVKTQSHVMMDVEYHFANLWFAAHKEQWDLAGFYLRESRSHLDWAVRMRPVRQIRGGGTVDLKAFQASIQTGFTAIEDSIGQKNTGAFAEAYRQTLTQCHACHEASGLGYLEPHIPTAAPSAMMIRE